MKSAASISFRPLANGEENPLPQEHLERLTLAHADAQVRSLAGKISFRIQEFCRKAAYSHLVEQAVESADPDAGVAGVVQALEQEFEFVSSALAAWNASATVADRRAREHSELSAKVLRQANNAKIRRQNEIVELRERLRDIRINGQRNSDRMAAYVTAGLSAEQINKLGDAGPAPAEIENLHVRMQSLDAEVRQLSAFISHPLHPCELLGEIELSDIDMVDVNKRELRVISSDIPFAKAIGHTDALDL